MMRYPLLEQINSKEDFLRIPEERMEELAAQMRGFLLDTVSRTGGHLASSLGAVELIMAIHRVFDGPEDKILFDVGHQAYAHKLITGRRAAFSTLRQAGGVSGFPKRAESPFDVFDAGHSSTSISAALGFARARALRGGREAVVALIGDGALTGGLAFEALNDAGQSKLPLIIVINDNDMSISQNVGALNRYLSEMRASTPYQNLKRRTVRVLDSNRLGKWLSKRMERMKNRIKYFLLPNVLFEAMGFTYLGPIDGHDFHALTNVLRKAGKLQRPVIVHAVTIKGKGYPPAEAAPEKYHGVGPFERATGKPLCEPERPSNAKVFGEQLLRLALRDERIVAVTAAMPAGTGLVPFAESLPERFFDVGIAEGHAVTMAAGMAAGGLRPVVAVYSTFLQRAYDEIFHDVCLQRLPVVLALDRAGLVGEDGETHHGAYDIVYLSSLPGMRVYSPASQQELQHMLEDALRQDGPCAIRYPRGSLMQMACAQPVELGRWETLRPLAPVTILATGRMVEPALRVARRRGMGLVNARTLRPFDEAMLDALPRQGVKALLTIEEGIVEGGFGARVAARLSGSGVTVRSMGLAQAPVPQGTVAWQMAQCGLTEADMEAAVEALERADT